MTVIIEELILQTKIIDNKCNKKDIINYEEIESLKKEIYLIKQKLKEYFTSIDIKKFDR